MILGITNLWVAASIEKSPHAKIRDRFGKPFFPHQRGTGDGGDIMTSVTHFAKECHSLKSLWGINTTTDHFHYCYEVVQRYLKSGLLGTSRAVLVKTFDVFTGITELTGFGLNVASFPETVSAFVTCSPFF